MLLLYLGHKFSGAMAGDPAILPAVVASRLAGLLTAIPKIVVQIGSDLNSGDIVYDSLQAYNTAVRNMMTSYCHAAQWFHFCNMALHFNVSNTPFSRPSAARALPLTLMDAVARWAAQVKAAAGELVVPPGVQERLAAALPAGL